MHPEGTRKAGGFTLVELLAVIAIIGILIALLLPAARQGGPIPHPKHPPRERLPAGHGLPETRSSKFRIGQNV